MTLLIELGLCSFTPLPTPGMSPRDFRYYPLTGYAPGMAKPKRMTRTRHRELTSDSSAFAWAEG